MSSVEGAWPYSGEISECNLQHAISGVPQLQTTSSQPQTASLSLGVLSVIFYFLESIFSSKTVSGNYFLFFWSPKHIQVQEAASLQAPT